MDPAPYILLALPKTPVFRRVDSSLSVGRVDKEFYTYYLERKSLPKIM